MSRPYHPGIKVPLIGTADEYKYTTKLVIIEGKEVICKVYESKDVRIDMEQNKHERRFHHVEQETI